MQGFNDRSKADRTTYLTWVGMTFLLLNVRRRRLAARLRNALPPGLNARAQLAVEVRFYCGPQSILKPAQPSDDGAHLDVRPS